jgi:hypothetical protein
MDSLKLIALDEADLAVISACLQDAVFKTGDTQFLGKDSVFTLEANRFVWEEGRDKKTFERRRALLVVKQVRSVRSLGANPRIPKRSIRCSPCAICPARKRPQARSNWSCPAAR